MVIILKLVRFGNKHIENVPVTVNSKLKTDLLLNKKTLDKVGVVIVDNINFMIIFE